MTNPDAQAETTVERIKAPLGFGDASKLNTLADWFDAKYPEESTNGNDEVQQDLRRIARGLLERDAFQARLAQAEEDIRQLRMLANAGVQAELRAQAAEAKIVQQKEQAEAELGRLREALRDEHEGWLSDSFQERGISSDPRHNESGDCYICHLLGIPPGTIR